MSHESIDGDTPESGNVNPGRSKARRLAVAGVAAGVVGGAAIGLLATLPGATSAATTSTTAAPQSTTPAGEAPADDAPNDAPNDAADDAARPTDAERVAQRTEKIRAELQPLIDDGTITAAQADAVAATLAAAAPDHPNRPGGQGGAPGGRLSDELAQTLGLADGAELREQLAAGNSIADIAAANGVSIDTVRDALRAEAEDRIATAVTDGKITQEEADAKLADLDDHIDAIINGDMPLGGPGRRPGPPPADNPTATTSPDA